MEIYTYWEHITNISCIQIFFIFIHSEFDTQFQLQALSGEALKTCF